MPKKLYADWIHKNYSRIWKRVTAEWSDAVGDNAVWMLDAANYLFCTSGVRWALDPVYFAHYVSAPSDVSDDLKGLKLVLLTHEHADHFDRSLLKQLCRNDDLVLAIPEFLSKSFFASMDEVNCDVRIVQPGAVINVDGLTATAFQSYHFADLPDSTERTGCESLGWLVEIGDKRFLFPGDVRDYSCGENLPDFGSIDMLFAHLWLGRGRALEFDQRYIDGFCDFVSHFNSERVCLAHLHEVSRIPEDYWTFTHAGIVMDQLLSYHPEIQCMMARAGQRIILW